jgi:hypothetical protein
MNNTNSLFVISVIMVSLLLISLNHSTLENFYVFSTSLNKAEIIPNFSTTSNEFQNVHDEKDSTCHTTPSMNQYCYKKLKIHDKQDKDHLSSFITGNNGINGELHFDRVGSGGGIFTIKNMVLSDDNSALITFADKDYRIGNKDQTTYEIVEDFEFTTTIEKYDSFITHCGNFEGTGATIVQYLGIATIDDVDYFLTWHTVIVPEDKFQCKYPEIIQYSLKHNFEEM